MNKIMMVLLVMMFLGLLVGCTPKDRPEPDAFRIDYPNLTDPEHVFVEIEYSGVVSLFDSGKHILYMGWPSCPWCQEYIYYYNERAKANNISAIYAYNHRSIRTYLIEDGEVIVNEEFLALVELIGVENVATRQVVRYLDEDGKEIRNFENVDEADIVTIPWIFAPTVFLIHHGVVFEVGISVVEGHVLYDGRLPSMPPSMQQVLYDRLDTLFSKYHS